MKNLRCYCDNCEVTFNIEKETSCPQCGRIHDAQGVIKIGPQKAHCGKCNNTFGVSLEQKKLRCPQCG